MVLAHNEGVRNNKWQDQASSPDAPAQGGGGDEMPVSSDTSLPVAKKVVPPPELLNRVCELEEQRDNRSHLPNVTLMNVNEENSQAHRCNCWVTIL